MSVRGSEGLWLCDSKVALVIKNVWSNRHTQKSSACNHSLCHSARKIYASLRDQQTVNPWRGSQHEHLRGRSVRCSTKRE